MGKRTVVALALLAGYASMTPGTELQLRVEAAGCHAAQVTVGPSCATPYRVRGELSDAASDGLAMVLFDLDFSGGPLVQANTPTTLPMSSFAPPAGLSNPDGYGGTPLGGGLVQVGGSQNVFGQGQWPCEADAECPAPAICVEEVCSAVPGQPLGTVVIGVAQPHAAASIVTGALTAPAVPGTYTVQLTNPVANVFEKGADGRPYWFNGPVDQVTVENLTLTVESGQPCCDVYEACCMSSTCSYLPPDECTDLGGVPSGLFCEEDADGDGVDGTCGDQCPNDPDKTAPGICGCGIPDVDSDGDGARDCVDGCPYDPDKTYPGYCGCGVPDTDSDGDYQPDCLDGCPLDPNKTDPGYCGCFEPEWDSDGDGLPDCVDECPYDPYKVEPGLCGCGVADVDSDGDTVPDCDDLCPDEDDTIDDNENGIPDCWEIVDVPAQGRWGQLVLILTVLAGMGLYLRPRRRA